MTTPRTVPPLTQAQHARRQVLMRELQQKAARRHRRDQLLDLGALLVAIAFLVVIGIVIANAAELALTEIR